MDNLTKPKIWEGKKKAFLVCDESLKNCDAPFYEFLRSEGYAYGAYKGSFGCPWVQRMNNIRERVTETVYTDVVFV